MGAIERTAIRPILRVGVIVGAGHTRAADEKVRQLLVETRRDLVSELMAATIIAFELH